MLGLSRSKVSDIVEAGGVVVNGQALTKSDRLVAGTYLEVALPKPALVRKPQVIPDLGILYDDDDIVIVDKPAPVAAHPSLGFDGLDVAGGLVAAGFQISTSGEVDRQGIVSRLDVGTSGAMVVAKNEAAFVGLKDAFKHRQVKKVYHALAQSRLEQDAGTIDAPIGRHPGSDWKFAVTADGREAVTHYQLVESLRGASLYEINLETGRTHQIRVHFSALKHPLVGDVIYGADPTVATKLGLDRQWLHASTLGFFHPINGEWVEVHSEFPADLAAALKSLDSV
jgi:23S rRNA pseudouridine1911/1915/1917 synthase